MREIGEKYDLQVLRFFMLSAHYRSPLNFSADLMEASKTSLERIITAVDNLKFLVGNAEDKELSLEEKESLTQAAAFETKFDEAMDDDFNTADAISAIFEMVKYVNTNISGENSKSFIQTVLDKMVNLCDVLGIIVDKKEEILALFWKIPERV